MKRPAQVSVTFLLLIALTLLLKNAGVVAFAQTMSPLPVSPAPTATLSSPTTASPELQSSTDAQTAADLDTLTLIAMPTRIGDDMSLKVKPGEKKQITLKVHNQSNAPVTITTVAEDFIIDEDGSTPIPVEAAEEDNRWSLASWLTVVPNLQTIKPNETKPLSVLIEVPADALPGGHYAMITHQPQTGNAAAGGENTSTGVNQRVGTLLYVVVEGQMMEEAFIRGLNVPQQLDFGPIPYSFKIDNESDVHLQPKLTFNVYNFWNKKIYSTALESKNIFPKYSRDFTGKWDRIWGFGRYKAEVVMVYGSASTTLLASTMFWFFPLKLLLAIGVGVITLVGMFLSIRRHLIHRSQDQSKRVRELEETVARMEEEKKSSSTQKE